MKKFRFAGWILAIGALLGAAEQLHAGVAVGIGIGFPGYYRPWYGCGYYYYPRPVYVVPPPAVYVAPAPAVVVPSYSAAPPAAAAPSTAPVPEPLTAPPTTSPGAPPPPPTPALPAPRRLNEQQLNNVNYYVTHLTDNDENARLDSVIQLGRSKAVTAIDPLAATLAGDAAPQVREAAAKALGIIGSPKALPALRRAAQADSNHDVRKAAQFSIEIIQAR